VLGDAGEISSNLRLAARRRLVIQEQRALRESLPYERMRVLLARVHNLYSNTEYVILNA
jgi:hypothetical protein